MSSRKAYDADAKRPTAEDEESDGGPRGKNSMQERDDPYELLGPEPSQQGVEDTQQQRREQNQRQDDDGVGCHFRQVSLVL